MKWTHEQEQAIISRDGSILVSAAAGSGKTAVLVERILRLLCDAEQPVRADRLLVVTFTKSAAAEMAARLKTALESRIAADPGNAYLRRQALLLGRAQISTVHAFCSTLLRDHFAELGIANDFTLADDITVLDLKNRALDTAMGLLYDDPDSDITALCDLFGRSRTDDDTAELIQDVHAFETNLAFPERWEQSVMTDLTDGAPFLESRAGSAMLDAVRWQLCAARDMAAEALEICADVPILEEKYAPAIRDDFRFLNTMLAHTEQRDLDDCRAVAASYKATGFGQTRGDFPEKSAVKNLRESIKKVIGRLNTHSFISDEAQYRADCTALADPYRALFRAVSVYGETLEKLKLERRTFEFSDLERYAIRLLSDADGNPTEAARAVSAQYDLIFVDEYQDTNEIQDLIFRCVSRDEKNLFFVGDLKQSIYSFRRADPEIFAQRRAHCYADETGLYPKRIALATNFRSAPSVIDGINAVFSTIMTRRTGGTDYALPGEALVADPDAPVDSGGFELHLIDKDTGDEPAHIAAAIRAMLRAGTPVRDKDTLRPCRPSDFCILLRATKNRAKAYADALDAAGIRCVADSGDNLFLRSEIAVLLSLLQVVDNPSLDIHVAAVLLSPLFSFTPDDLVALRGRDRHMRLYTLLGQWNDDRAAQFLQRVQLLRDCRNTLPIGEFVQFCIDTLDAETLLCAGENYIQNRANQRLFIDYADDFARRSAGGLGAFLRVCAAATKSKQGLKHEFSRPDNAVCLSTIHGAKGLEWPIVIVANAEKEFNTRDISKATMLFDSGAGTGTRLRTAEGAAYYKRKTISFAALAQVKLDKAKAEEMRILYVALTRAKQKVIVTAVLDKIAEKLDGWALRSRSATEYNVVDCATTIDWIGIAYCAAQPDPLRADPRLNPIRLVLPDDDPSAETADAARAEPAPPNDPARIAAINRRASFVNPHAALQTIPGKLSVTDLVKEHHAAPLYRPAFARRTELSAVERGSALHLFMQLADYSRAAENLEAERARLVDRQYLDAALAQGADLKKLASFFASDLGKKVSAPDARLLREYDFIDAVDAAEILDVPPDCAGQKIMVQGIADCILLEPDGAVLIDYKSDRVDNPDILIQRYGLQLQRYKAALDRRLPLPVKQCLIYSFELGQAIEIPCR